MNKRIRKKKHIKAKLYKKIIGKKLRRILRDISLYSLPMNLMDDKYYMTCKEYLLKFRVEENYNE